MTPLPILGGFKILKDVVRISLISSHEDKGFPAKLFNAIACEKINLPFLTSVHGAGTWGLNLAAEAADEARTQALISRDFGRIFQSSTGSAILSLFPHKNNPAITGTLFETLTEKGLEPEALANSPSAVSVVLKEEFLNQASDALFGPFSFSAYRTPSDWKLAQKGKEQLYKEVVASYQEKRPKVYGLNYRDSQEVFIIKLAMRRIGAFGTFLKALSSHGIDLSFLASSPTKEGKVNIFFCLPKSGSKVYHDLLKTMDSQIEIEAASSAATFSMTGPHFGDRFGIASELLHALGRAGVDLIAFTCTIASVRGVVPAPQIERTIKAIQAVFEVPAVNKKD